MLKKLSQYSNTIVFQLNNKLVITDIWPEANCFSKIFSTGLHNKKFTSLLNKKQLPVFNTVVQSKHALIKPQEFLLKISSTQYEWFSIKFTKQGNNKIVSVNNIHLLKQNIQQNQEAVKIKLYKEFLDNIPVPFGISSLDFNLIFLNKKFTETYGYTIDEIKDYKKWFSKFKFESSDGEDKHDKEFYASLAKSKKNPNATLPFLYRQWYAKSGELKDIRIAFKILGNQMFGIVEDITEQQKAEAKLKENERLFKALVNNIALPVACYDSNTMQLVFINKPFTQTIGYQLNEIQEFKDWYGILFYEDKTIKHKESLLWQKAVDERKKGKTAQISQFERPIKCKNGAVKLFEVTITVNKNIVYGVFKDITKQKEMENLLKGSEHLFKNLIHNIALPVGCYDINTLDYVFVNEPFTKTLGYQLHEIKKLEEWYGIIAYENEEIKQANNLLWQKAVNERINKKNNKPAFFERPIKCKDGSIKLFEISFTVNNNLVYSIFKDITQQKEAENLLKESEQRFRTLAENMPIAIGSHDFDGNIIFFNKHFTKATGYTLKDIPTLNHWYNLTQPNPIIRNKFYTHWLLTIKKYKEGKLKKQPYIESAALCKNEKFKTFNYLFNIVKNTVYIILVDVTELKEAGKQLSESYQQLRELTNHLQKVREEERKFIAQEIHDEFGQLITGLKFDISIIKRKIEKEMPQMATELNETMQLTDRIVKTVRRISTELRPSIIDDVGLAAAIEWECKEFSKRTKIICNFSNKYKTELLSIEKKSSLFRIFQETFTNILRHSNANNVNVLIKKKKEKLILQIEDNGKGFIINPQLKTLGIIGMRERALAIGGNYSIKSQPGKGTKTYVEIPV